MICSLVDDEGGYESTKGGQSCVVSMAHCNTMA